MNKDEKIILNNALGLFEEIKANIDDTMLICALGVWADDNEFLIDQTIMELKSLLEDMEYDDDTQAAKES